MPKCWQHLLTVRVSQKTAMINVDRIKIHKYLSDPYFRTTNPNKSKFDIITKDLFSFNKGNSYTTSKGTLHMNG